MTSEPRGLRLVLRYTQERFPIPGALLYAGALSLCAWSFAGTLSAAGATDLPRAAAVVVVAFGVLLRLRIVDEHKDFARDRVAWPDRLLSRGLITLAQLRRVFVVALIAEASACAWLGGPAQVAWLVMAGYLYLMHVEFFVPAFLDAHIGWYLVTHQVLMPLTAALAVAARCDPRSMASGEPAQVAVLLLGTMCATMTWEMARKTWPPEREHACAASYTRDWGRPRTVLATQLAAWLGAGALGWLQWSNGCHRGFLAAIVATGVLLLAVDLAFLARPSAAASKLVATAGAVHMLGLLGGSALAFAV